MTWRSLRRWFQPSARATAPRRRSHRLTLEALEDRFCPSTSNIAITVQPTSQVVPVKGSVTLSASATGDPAPTIQWQFSIDQGKTFVNFSGGTHDQLTFTAPSSPVVDMFRAVFTNSSGSVDTNAVSVTAAVAPSPGVSPISQTIVAGSSVTFTAAGNGLPTPNVQWQVSHDSGKTFTNIPLANTGTLTFTAAAGQNGDEFRAAFSNPVGSAYSGVATLTVDFGPTITTPPASQTVRIGTPVTLTAAATGNPAPTPQWQTSPDNGQTWTDIAGATHNTYSFTAPSQPAVALYRVEFSSALGPVASPPATLTFNSPPLVNVSPASQTVNDGKQVTFTAAATSIPAPTIQWQFSTDGGKTFTNIKDATTNSITFTVHANMDGDQFQAVFTSSSGTATSSVATLTVHYAPSPPPALNTLTVPAGSTVTLTATPTGDPTPTVQWQASLDGKHFTTVGGATLPKFVFSAPPSAATMYFRAIFTNSLGSATSPIYTVVVDVPPVVKTNPINLTVAAGTVVTFTAAATGTPAPHVQWQVSSDGGKTFSALKFANTNTLTFTAGAAQNGYEYRAEYTNGGGKVDTTPGTLTVDSIPVITTQPTSQLVATGSQVTLTAAANGAPTPTVQWQVSTDGGQHYSPISNATQTTYTFTAPPAPTVEYFRAVFTNTLGSSTTHTARITVGELPAVSTNPTSQTVASGGTVTFAAAATGTPALTVQWQVSHDQGQTFTNLPFATTASLTFVAHNALNGDEFRAVFTNGVGTIDTTAATLAVNFKPTVTTQPKTQKVTVGSTVTLTAAATGNPLPTVQWQVSSDGTNFTDIAGATSTTYSFTAGTTSKKYYRAVFTNSVGTAKSAAAVVTVSAAAAQ